MNYGRIYSATFENTAIGTAAQSIMEVQVPDNSICVVLRAWVSPGIGTPTDEVLAISLYGNDAVATSGTAMTEQPLTPAAAADPSNCVALLEPTIAATPLILYSDAYHAQNGWLYLPVPEERPTFIGGNADPGDNFGIELAVASTATPSVSGGIVWAEISAA
jgi:hypothetical protein